ncbi:hypothetical protein SOVF_142600 [Spinacia oleracea]|nr:hypothetical protein SOVF_142600 [Spinacia oleracea]
MGLASKKPENSSSTPFAQSTHHLHSATNNYRILNNEADLLFTTTSNVNEDNNESQHVATSSKQLGEAPLASSSLNSSTSFSKTPLNFPKDSETKKQANFSFSRSLSSSKKSPSSSSLSPCNGVKSTGEIELHRQSNSSNLNLSKETTRVQEKEGRLQDSSQHSGEVAGGSLGIETSHNIELVSNIPDFDMHDQEGGTSNNGGTAREFEDPQLTELQGTTILSPTVGSESSTRETPTISDNGGTKTEFGAQKLGVRATNPSSDYESTTITTRCKVDRFLYKSAPEHQKFPLLESPFTGKIYSDSSRDSSEKWGSCKLSSEDSKSTDEGKFLSNQSNRFWQKPESTAILGSVQNSEQSGVLGSWSSSKLLSPGPEVAILKPPGTDSCLLSRCKEPYRPPPFYKAMNHSGILNHDTSSNETSVCAECPSKEKAMEGSLITNELGASRWTTWKTGKCRLPWDQLVYIEKGEVRVVPEGSKQYMSFKAGDLVCYPKWFEVDLVRFPKFFSFK